MNATAVQPHGRSAPMLRRPVVLCVGVHHLVTGLLPAYLRRAGADVVAAARGAAALVRLVETGPVPDLIFAEIDAAATGAAELLDLLRADRSLATIPVIAVSTSGAQPADPSLPRAFGIEAVLGAVRGLGTGAPRAGAAPAQPQRQ